MGKLRISTTMTVDGVIEVAEWYVAGGDHTAAAFAMFDGVDAMLMGRKTYEGLAGYWPAQEGEWADLLNPLPKYVASRTLQPPLEWNAKLIERDADEGVAKLKENLEGDLFLTAAASSRATSSSAGSSTHSTSGSIPRWLGRVLGRSRRTRARR